jgi:hypothetical protein
MTEDGSRDDRVLGAHEIAKTLRRRSARARIGAVLEAKGADRKPLRRQIELLALELAALDILLAEWDGDLLAAADIAERIEHAESSLGQIEENVQRGSARSRAAEAASGNLPR